MRLNRFEKLALAYEVGAWILRRRFRYKVSGESMKPEFADGDHVIVKPIGEFASIATCDVVVARHSYKNIDVIKYVQSIEDQPQSSKQPKPIMIRLWSPSGSDSRQFGQIPKSNIRGQVTTNLSKRVLVQSLPCAEQKKLNESGKY